MCEHERLRTVGNDVFCCECGVQLPLEFLLNKGKKKEDPAPEAEVPAEVSEPAQEEQKPVIQPAEKEKCAIPAPKKERAKTTRKTAKKGE